MSHSLYLGLRIVCVVLSMGALSLCASCVDANTPNVPKQSTPPITAQILRLPADVTADSQKQRWWQITMKGGDLFEKIVLLDDAPRKRELEALVAAFGGDPEVDMAIASSSAPFFLAKGVRGSFSSWVDRADTKKEKEAVALLARAEHEMTELLVRRLLSDPELLERYYRLTVWTRDFHAGRFERVPVLARMYRDEFPEPGAPEYWWYVRQFLLLARATDRLDLIESTPHDQFDKAFEKWCKWLDAHSSRMIRKGGDLHWTPGSKKVYDHGSLPRMDVPFPGLNHDNFFPKLYVVLDQYGFNFPNE